MFRAFTIAAAALFTVALGQPVAAGSRAYVKSTGSDALNCLSEANACKTMSTAIAAAGANGEVLCLDAGFSGFFAITFSITINCEFEIFQTGINFNTISVGPTDTVILNGFDMDMRKAVNGVPLTITGAGTVILRNGRISNSLSNGLVVAPTGALNLVMENVFVSSVPVAGIYLGANGGSLNAQLTDVRVEKADGCAIGIDGSGSTVGVNVTINGGAATTSGNGILAFTVPGKAPVIATTIGTQFGGNQTGINANGGVLVNVGAARIAGNGSAAIAVNGAQILTFGDNYVAGNVANGTFTGAVAKQ